MPAYSVIISRRGKLIHFEDSFLPGILISDRALENMRSDNVERLGLCKDCPTHGAICHVGIYEYNDYYKWVQVKYCPILFNDALKPKWKVKELV